jgi:hypothetical protein
VTGAGPATLLALADQRLPAGGHVHSGGIEEAVRAGLVHDPASLAAFLARRLVTVGRVVAGVAAAAVDATSATVGRLDARRTPGRAAWPAPHVDLGWAELDLVERVPGFDVVLVESGGDNLTASFSRGLVDVQVFVIDVAGGDKVPRKGGPGVTGADLLVINKRDLAPFVGADLDVMTGDADRVRGGRPVALVSLRDDPSAGPVRSWLLAELEHHRSHRPAPPAAADHAREARSGTDRRA